MNAKKRKKKGVVGRKQEFSVKEVAKALKATNGYSTYAAKKLGCSYATVENYLNRYPELREIKYLAGKELTDHAEFILSKNIELACLKSVKSVEIIKKASKENNYNLITSMNTDKAAVDLALKVLARKESEKLAGKDEDFDKYKGKTTDDLNELLKEKLEQLKTIKKQVDHKVELAKMAEAEAKAEALEQETETAC